MATADHDADQIPGQQALFATPAATAPDQQSQVDELRELAAANAAKYRELLAQQLVPDPRAVLAIRLDTLLDLTLSPPARLRYNLLFETRMSVFLDDCLTQQKRAELLAPLANPPAAAPPGRGGLIVPPH